MTGLQVDSIDRIIATDQVAISQAGHTLQAEEAVFSLRKETAEFNGNPRIETSGAYLSGHSIRSEEGLVIIDGSEESGRAQMIISRSGGLGISKTIPLDQDTTVLADTIRMQELETENQFDFEGSVEVVSGTMSVRSDILTLYLQPTGDEDLKVLASANSI